MLYPLTFLLTSTFCILHFTFPQVQAYRSIENAGYKKLHFKVKGFNLQAVEILKYVGLSFKPWCTRRLILPSWFFYIFQLHTCGHFFTKIFLLMARKEHRGRIQAQGGGLEASERWRQSEPLSKEKALALLTRLRSRLSPSEQTAREWLFEAAKCLIETAEGSIDAPVRKSFNDPYDSKLRLDVEVWSGAALVLTNWELAMGTPVNALHPNLLAAYARAERYWQQRFTQLLAPHGLSHQPFYNRYAGSGRKIADGNPIFDAYVPQRHKLVRIMQHDPAVAPGELLRFYTDVWPTGEMAPELRPRPAEPAKRNAPIPELVIALFLTEETALQVDELVRGWIIEDFDASKMVREELG